MTARRRLLATTIVAAALLAIIAWPEPRSANRSGMTPEDVAVYLAETPGVPLVLPRQLRPGTVWLGPESAEQTTDGAVTVRTSTFTHVPIDSGPIVRICSQGRDERVQCPARDVTIRRTTEEGDVVVIDFSGSEVKAAELTWWREVPLVSREVPEWVR